MKFYIVADEDWWQKADPFLEISQQLSSLQTSSKGTSTPEGR